MVNAHYAQAISSVLPVPLMAQIFYLTVLLAFTAISITQQVEFVVLHVCRVNTKIHGIIVVQLVIQVVVLVMDQLLSPVFRALVPLYYSLIRQEDTV